MDAAAFIFAAVALGLASGAVISVVWLGQRLAAAEGRITAAERECGTTTGATYRALGLALKLGAEIDQLAARVRDLSDDDYIAEIVNEQIDLYDQGRCCELDRTAGHEPDPKPNEVDIDVTCDGRLP